MLNRNTSLIAIAVALLVPLLGLGLFVDKAFNIDDTLFLWVAKQICQHPLDFYGFTANWHGFEQPMSQITKNPPLVSYYIALAATVLGWEEISLHSAFLIWAGLWSLGVFFLARRLCPFPLLATLAAVLTPVFLVSSATVMADTAMSCLYVWAAVAWLKGMEERSRIYLLTSAVLITLSTLCKYFGLSLAPLLFAYSALKEKKVGSWAVYLAIPCVMALGYEFLTMRLYGTGMISSAMSCSLASRFVGGSVDVRAMYGLAGLSFTGGGVLTAMFYWPLLWSWRALACSVALVVVFAFALVVTKWSGTVNPASANPASLGVVIHMAVFTFAGIHILALSYLDVRERGDAESLFLFLWVLGTFVFAAFVNWTPNARAILPMAPPVGILLMRRLARSAGNGGNVKRLRAALPLIPAAVAAFFVAYADMSQANCQRTVADVIQQKFSRARQTVWFMGHWGFQYYMESAGAKPLDFKSSSPREGDIVVVPLQNCDTRQLIPDRFRLVASVELTPFPWVATMDQPLGAAFYAAFRGPLPFAVGKAEPQIYLIYIATRPEPK